MHWTSNKPTSAGWYWWRYDSSGKPAIMFISYNHTIKNDVFTVGTMVLFIDELPGEWSSTPIPEPRSTP